MIRRQPFRKPPPPPACHVRMTKAEYSPELDNAPCQFCALTEPGEACKRCGIPTPLPVKRGL